jgi:hypothetical protein
MGNKDLIKQYVDTGLKLGEHQVESLTPNLFKTYIRKRLMSIDQHVGSKIEKYEFQLMSKETKLDYLNKRLINAYNDVLKRIEKWEYVNMPEKMKIQYLKTLLKLIFTGKYDRVFFVLMAGTSPGIMEEWEYNETGIYFGEQTQKKYLTYRLKKDAWLELWEFDELDTNQKINYITRIEKNKYDTYMYVNHIGKDNFSKLMGRDNVEITPKNNRDWDVTPRRNQINESIKRHKEIIGYVK